MVKDILKLIRVKQWVKNAFVLAPLLFSLKFTEFASDFNAALAFAAFCLTASFVYILNDILDRKRDALHPHKKNRPIASGRINLPTAWALAFLVLFGAVFCLEVLGNVKTAITIGLYVLLNVFYSFKLKHVVLIDVMVIAVGFILRVYAGAYAINVPVSSFIFMTTLFLSLFLGFTKRKSELLKTGSETRQVLNRYSDAMVDQYIMITVALTIMCYALYTLEPQTISRFDTNRLCYSVIFVSYGLFRYIYILNSSSDAEDPTENLFKDKGLILACFLYVGYVLAIFLKLI